MIRTFILILAGISFIVVMGGAVYEHAAVVPVWTSAVPLSLAMFQGEFGLAPSNFWIPIHPLTVALLVLALITNWRTLRRNYILGTLVGYIVILAITFVYFVPELMAITQTEFSQTVNAQVTQRANFWEAMSLVRLGCLFVLSVILLFGLSRPERADQP